MPHEQPGLDGRHRDIDGTISRKHGNTLVETLRGIYGPGFAPGVPGDTDLKTLLEGAGAASLSEYLKG